MKREIGIALKDVLDLALWQKARVVAGREGLDRVVKSVNIMEVPDIAKWVKEGEFLLTTVYAIKDDLEAQRRLIPTLAERGLAGIGIKPGRYIEEIPPIMLQLADDYLFPIIELPFETSFADLVDSILSEILNVQALFLKKSMDTHEMLMDVVLKGGRLEEIVNTLASLIQNPVVMTNNQFEVLAQELLGGLTKEELFYQENSQGFWRLKADYAPGKQVMGRFRESQLFFGEREIRQLSIPIVVGHENYGYIFVWEENRSLAGIDLISIERAVTVAAMDIINQQSIFEVERRYQNDLLYDLLNGRFETKDVILSRAKAMQWQLQGPFVIIIFELAEDLGEKRDSRETHFTRNRIVQGIKGICEKQPSEVIFGEWGKKLILLHSVQGVLAEELNRNLNTVIQQIQALLDQFQEEYFIGVSTVSEKVSQLQGIYQEAKESIRVGRLRGEVGQIFYYDKLGVSRLLHQIEPGVLQDFLNDTLKPLLDYDRRNNTELVQTLDHYFQFDGNLKQLARELYLHYNTIIYRMERIQQILQVDLQQREDRLNIEIALKIHFG